LINFPKLTAPNLQISATGLIGSSTSPIGIQKLSLLPISFINDQGRGNLLNYFDILSLAQDISSVYSLYPIYLPPVIPNNPNPSINTTASEQAVYNSEQRLSNKLRKKENIYGTKIHIMDETYVQKPYNVLFNDSWASFDGMREVNKD
jgi:hypothetical protein